MTSRLVGGALVVPVAVVGLEDADGDAQQVVDRLHPERVAAGQVVVDRDQVDALALTGLPSSSRAASAFSAIGSVAVSVLPSPVFISAIEPSCSTMPPISWTSKWRWPRVRLAASRVSAKDSNSRSSSDSPSSARSRRAVVARAQLLVGLELELGLEVVDARDVLLELP